MSPSSEEHTDLMAPMNEEQFEGRIADAMRSLGPDVAATACFVMTKDGIGKVGIRVMGDDPELQKSFMLGVMSSCIDMLVDLQEDGNINTNWYKEDDDLAD